MSKIIPGSICEKCLLLLIFITLAISINGKPFESPNEISRKTCGRALVIRVDQICQSRGGHMTHTGVRTSRRVRRGIVNECCFNKCADRHIYAYCSNQGEGDEVKTSENESIPSHETPMEVSDKPEAQPLIRLPDFIDVTETSTPVETTTETVSIHFQIGTVPPEYRISPFVPSYSRLLV